MKLAGPSLLCGLLIGVKGAPPIEKIRLFGADIDVSNPHSSPTLKPSFPSVSAFHQVETPTTAETLQSAKEGQYKSTSTSALDQKSNIIRKYFVGGSLRLGDLIPSLKIQPKQKYTARQKDVIYTTRKRLRDKLLNLDGKDGQRKKLEKVLIDYGAEDDRPPLSKSQIGYQDRTARKKELGLKAKDPFPKELRNSVYAGRRRQ